MTGRAGILGQAGGMVVWSSSGKLPPGGSNLVPVLRGYSGSGCELSSLGWWQFQVALVCCHKDVISSVLSGIQGDCKVTAERMT
jgi:hypothetical protein